MALGGRGYLQCEVVVSRSISPRSGGIATGNSRWYVARIVPSDWAVSDQSHTVDRRQILAIAANY